MRYVPHAYQERATRFIIDNRYCALFLDMGLGKTVATLTALRILKEEYCEVRHTLVIAPKSVARNTWTSESHKWDHLRDFIGFPSSLMYLTPVPNKTTLG